MHVLGVIAVGIFAENPFPLDTTSGRSGLLKGGGLYLLGIQCLTVLCLLTWGIVSTIILLWLINKIIVIRMDIHVELLGADLTEHLVKHGHLGISRALSAFRPVLGTSDIDHLNEVGSNPGHNKHLDTVKSFKKRQYNIYKILKEITKDKNLGINFSKNLLPKKKIKPNTKRIAKAKNGSTPLSNTIAANPYIAWTE
ncbi:hypothetical protein NQ317_013962 [Molorchus minor]|uniref:Ammonium transporter AmtB-like domain-containing protein n=1 Tax=Molorchus minor TaxID=1323400 RepID=A0ABQ9J1K7_9CUCU|nr:hypothetical protein NQ317_013962 [Molorchus minor]